MGYPLAEQDILEQRMRNALLQLVIAMRGVQDVTFELRSQEFTTEADALQVVLDDLKTQYDAIVIAITT